MLLIEIELHVREKERLEGGGGVEGGQRTFILVTGTTVHRTYLSAVYEISVP